MKKTVVDGDRLAVQGDNVSDPDGDSETDSELSTTYNNVPVPISSISFYFLEQIPKNADMR